MIADFERIEGAARIAMGDHSLDRGGFAERHTVVGQLAAFIAQFALSAFRRLAGPIA
jgi:hypothetical protein